MKTITVSLVDSDIETVQAEYFQIEDGWVTFKSDDHKVVAAYPEKRVTRIKSETQVATGQIIVNSHLESMTPEKAAQAIAEYMKRRVVVEA